MASSEAHIHQLESASASVRRALAQPKPWDVAAKAQELAKALKTLQLALQQVRSIRPPKSKVIACGGAYSMLLAVLQSKASAAAGPPNASKSDANSLFSPGFSNEVHPSAGPLSCPKLRQRSQRF